MAADRRQRVALCFKHQRKHLSAEGNRDDVCARFGPLVHRAGNVGALGLCAERATSCCVHDDSTGQSEGECPGFDPGFRAGAGGDDRQLDSANGARAADAATSAASDQRRRS